VPHIGCFSSAGLTGDAMANTIALIGCALQQAMECDEPHEIIASPTLIAETVAFSFAYLRFLKRA
jgi:hypothetical protein